MTGLRRAYDILAFHLAQLGRVGLVGLAALAGAGVVYVHALQMRDEAAGLRGQLARLAALPAAGRPDADAPRLPDLPAAGEAPAALGQLFEAAEAAGLEVDRGEYRVTREVGAPYARYRVHLPLYGRYPAIRDFLARVLNANPALALEALSLRREAVEETELEATLRFTLYLEARP